MTSHLADSQPRWRRCARRTASPLTPHAVKGTTMPSSPATSRRSFLAGGAALAAIPAVATLTGGALADPAFADQASTDTLPDYAPIPPSALGPALNEQGYFVGRVEKNLYWVTDGSYQAAFLTTREGVVLFDAPPTNEHHLLLVGGERVRLAWQGTNHTPDNIYIHLPDHDTLMLVDIVLPRWVPF